MGQDAEAKSPLIKGQLIDSKHLAAHLSEGAIVPWTLQDFAEQQEAQAQQKQAQILQEVEKQLAPELQKRRAQLKQEIYDDAYQAGYEAGFALGQSEGEATGKAQAYSEARDYLFTKLAQISELLQTLQTPYAQLQSSVFVQLTDFALFAAQQVLNQHIAQNSDWLQQAIEQAIATLPPSDAPLEVALNPEDYAFIQTLQPHWLQQWSIQADAQVQPGNCDVKRADSLVHNHWQERFLAVQEQLLQQAQTLEFAEDTALASVESLTQEPLSSLPWEQDSDSASPSVSRSQPSPSSYPLNGDAAPAPKAENDNPT
ncbi:MAG: hypothetical protein JXR44_04440 [Thiotrichales bacterium]|nr:hypothetical protein [Thiotrichales bacterium]